jgi:hypothetical protein
MLTDRADFAEQGGALSVRAFAALLDSIAMPADCLPQSSMVCAAGWLRLTTGCR